ncbi:major facilitator superfamily transporter [Rhodococcus opacus PD630]|uniref:MFS transporter n=1 Tax=Rhodococcus opacus TaxID=37919 RepID=UPI00029CC749|nr:MFS transporter [Rhodococcus opacus]KXF49944.1 MFS transporter [Rhodococcus sp. SC4]RZK71006.1 MAG: MFS transporter [Rhodococcus sp. (in: high G+C Gram-positive bacteria)]AHK31850.1 Hexuronate transporter [Rhodococcus opacus PD630]EHI45152.1 major facilitator superfamily transporter [Rhodococcus opacus PD630]UDG94342.1 MFS transporter [Rhodococcus opacus PD630]
MVTIETSPGDTGHRRLRPASRRAWGIVVLLFLFFTLNFADKAAIGLASHQIRDDLGITAGQYGLLSSAFFWLFAVGAVTLTAVLRKISYTWGAGLLMVTWIVSMLPLTVQTSFGVLLVCRIALGFFEGPAHALCQSIVADRFAPDKRATAGALVNAGSSVGPLVAAPVLTWVILTWTWHAAFAVLVALGVLWVIGWFWYTEKLPFKRTEAAVEGVAKIEDPNGKIVVPFRRLLTLQSFWGLVLLSFAGYLISSLKVAWLPAYMNEGLGYSASTVGTLVTLPYIVAVAVLLSAGLLSGRLLRKGYSSRVARGYLTGAYLLVGGISMVIFTQLAPGPLQLIFVIAAFAVNSVAFSVAFAGASDFLPARQRVAFFGCIIAAYSVAGIVAPYALGLIIEHAPSAAQGYSTGFMFVGITVCVLGVVGGVMLNPERAKARLENLTAEYAAREAR